MCFFKRHFVEFLTGCSYEIFALDTFVKKTQSQIVELEKML